MTHSLEAEMPTLPPLSATLSTIVELPPIVKLTPVLAAHTQWEMRLPLPVAMPRLPLPLAVHPLTLPLAPMTMPSPGLWALAWQSMILHCELQEMPRLPHPRTRQLFAVPPLPRKMPVLPQLSTRRFSTTRSVEVAGLSAATPCVGHPRTVPFRMVTLTCGVWTRMPVIAPAVPATSKPPRSSVTLSALILMPCCPERPVRLPVT